MCNMASFVLTRDRVFWSRHTDSHTEIVSEFKLSEDRTGVHPNLLMVEITPPNEDYRLPLRQWTYRTDQDILPEWYDAEREEARARAALAEWATERLHVDKVETVTITDAAALVINCSSVVARDSSRVVARDSSRVEARGNSRVVAWDSTTITTFHSTVTTTISSARAVLINRSVDPPVCHVGPQPKEDANAD
jgi:hypothetical protein